MTGRPLRVAFYSDADAVGGAETVLASLLAELDPAIEAILLGSHPGVLDRLAAARPGSRSERLDPLVDKRDAASFLRHRSRFASLDADVFHFNLRSLWSCQYAIVAALSLRGPAVVAVEHSPIASPSATSRRLKRWTSSRLAAHVTVGTRVAGTIESLVGRAPGSMRVIPNGVAIPATTPSSPGPGPYTVGTVARLDRWKGIDLLVRAAAALDEDVRVVVIGDGDQRDALQRLGDELGLRDRLELRGWRSDAMAEVARTCHVFVLPSRLEAFPLTVLEAMAWGVPVVATDVGSTAESVREGLTGELVPPDDVEELAAALARLRDPALRTDRREAARALVAEEFTAARMARRYEALYREVSAGRRRR